MFRFRVYKTKKFPEPDTSAVDQPEEDSQYDYHIKQVFVGHHSIITLIAFTVGGILVGRSLYEILTSSIGVLGTMLVGFILFAAAGLYIGSFRG